MHVNGRNHFFAIVRYVTAMCVPRYVTECVPMLLPASMYTIMFVFPQ